MSVCGYEDRFYYDRGWWKRWCAREPSHTGSHHEASPSTTDAEMFANIQALQNELRAIASPVETEEGDEETESATVILEAAQTVDPLSVKNASPKKIIKAALAAGFVVTVVTTQTLTRGKQFKTGANKGTFRPDKEATILMLNGVLGAVAAFSLTFRSGLFQDGFVRDVAGWPTELHFDYTPSVIVKNAMGADRALAAAAHQDATYNDGADYVNMAKRFVNTTRDLEEWMADVMPGFVPRKVAVRKTTLEPTGLELIAGGEWSE